MTYLDSGSSRSFRRRSNRCSRSSGPHNDATAPQDVFAEAQLAQSGEGCLDYIGRIFGSQRFAQNVTDTDRFQDGPNGLTGDDPSSGRRRPQQHASTTIIGQSLVRDSGVAQRNRHHPAFGDFSAFADRISHFTGFPKPQTHAALFVTHDNQSAEAEAPTTLHYLSGAINIDDLLSKLIAALVAIALSTVTTRSASRPTPATTIAAPAEIAASATLTARAVTRLPRGL